MNKDQTYVLYHCVGDDNSVENKCDISVTRVNGKVACQNEIVFEDNFDDLSTENWSHIVQIPNEPVSIH